MQPVTRYEVQRLHAPDAWGPLFGEGPVRFADAKAAESKWREQDHGNWRGSLRVVAVPGVLLVAQLDLEEFVVPIVAKFWRLHAPGVERDVLGVHLDDDRRRDVESDWARLSGWEDRTIYYAPEVELPALRQRFPWARPRNLEAVLRLLTLHELAHYVHGHNGLSVSFDVPRAEQPARFAAMEREADELATVWWCEGLTPGNVPRRKAVAS